jgi:hypothetical protein
MQRKQVQGPLYQLSFYSFAGILARGVDSFDAKPHK